MGLEPVEVQHVRIGRRLLGYEPATVDRLLEDVTASYEEAWFDRQSLRERVEGLEGELDRTRERERLVGDVLVNAQRTAEQTVAEARETAEDILDGARRKADEIVSAAQREPDRLREEIRRLEAIKSAMYARFRAFLSEAHTLLEEGPDDSPADEAPLGRLLLPEGLLPTEDGGAGDSARIPSARGYSSAGRAPGSHPGGRRFEPG